MFNVDENNQQNKMALFKHLERSVKGIEKENPLQVNKGNSLNIITKTIKVAKQPE